MNKYSIHLVVGSELDAEVTGQLENCLNGIEAVLNSNGLASELVMVTPVDQEWLDRVHAELDEVDEEEFLDAQRPPHPDS